MANSFYQNVPKWIIQNLRGKKCTKCNHEVNKNDIYAIGIKNHNDQICTFIDFECSSCKNKVSRIFNFHSPQTIQSFCFLLLDEQKNKIVNQERKNINNSGPITDKEFENFKKKLNKNKTHYDFMKQIGSLKFHDMLEKFKENENK